MSRQYRQQARRAGQAAISPTRPHGSAAVATGGTLLRNPNDVGVNSRMAQFVQDSRHVGRPVNTTLAFEPKIMEFEEFCDHCYSHDPFRYNLDHEKLYKFMFYTSMREKKKRGGRRKKAAEGEVNSKFDTEDYDRIASAFISGAMLDYPQPQNPISDATFQQYKAVLKSVHVEQRSTGVCGIPWDIVWDLTCSNLQKHVKERLPALKRANYVEKVDGEFAPYAVVERYQDIEELMWRDTMSSRSRRSLHSKLRHRACCLYLRSGILRAESVHRHEVSDFLGLWPPKKDNDVHRPWLIISQIPVGKTNHGRKLYGRATRHRDVRLCAPGAISFYMQHRIDASREFSEMSVEQWMDNRAWFDIKFLVDISGTDNTVEMSNDSYSEHIKSVLQRLQLPTNKLLHLGRNLGSKTLELLEVESEEIRRMGQWNPSVFDNSYSCKLPMNAIRQLAGYNSANGMYFLPRGAVMPSQELCDMTPIGKWCYKALFALGESDPNGQHQTALEVLRWFCDLCVIFLQDAAAMMVLHPERSECSLFSVLPLFETQEFKVRGRIDTNDDNANILVLTDDITDLVSTGI